MREGQMLWVIRAGFKFPSTVEGHWNRQPISALKGSSTGYFPHHPGSTVLIASGTSKLWGGGRAQGQGTQGQEGLC